MLKIRIVCIRSLSGQRGNVLRNRWSDRGGFTTRETHHLSTAQAVTSPQKAPRHLLRRIPSCLGSAFLLLTLRKCGAFDAHPLPGHLKQMWTFQERGRTLRIFLQLWESESRDGKVWVCATRIRRVSLLHTCLFKC